LNATEVGSVTEENCQALFPKNGPRFASDQRNSPRDIQEAATTHQSYSSSLFYSVSLHCLSEAIATSSVPQVVDMQLEEDDSLIVGAEHDSRPRTPN